MRAFSGQRAILSHEMHLDGSPAQVFPLLCPVREYDWIEQWECEIIHSRSGIAELDCVFRTDLPLLGGPEIWVVCEYDPPRQIAFVRTGRHRTMRYIISLEAVGTGTRATWTQVQTGLDQDGNQMVADAESTSFDAIMTALETKLNHWLRTGTILRAAADQPED